MQSRLTSRTALFAALIMATTMLGTSPVLAFEKGKRIVEKSERSLPKLFTLNLGKPWQEVTAFFPSSIGLAAKSHRPNECGTDTFFTVQTDFLNDMPRGTLEEFFTRIPVTDVTTMLRRMFYPKGEVIEKIAPVRAKFANTEAYQGLYNITFSNNKRYSTRYYMTYQSGYMVHVTAYALPQDRDRAGACFNTLFNTLTFLEVKI